MNNNVLIILGMHRSGTSLTAQWLKKCGLDIGDKLMGAAFSNKDGHFEDLDFHDLHEYIFRNHNIPYGGFKNIENFQPTKNEINKLKDLVAEKNKKNKQWGWKEPRTCLFINDYVKIIPNVKVLVVIRDYNSIINSLVNREIILKKLTNNKIKIIDSFYNKIKIKKLTIEFTKATIEYYKRILYFLKNYNSNNFFLFSFEDILTYENDIINQLQEWDIKITPIQLKKIIKKELINNSGVYIKIPKKLRKEIEDIYTNIQSFKHSY